MNLIKRGLAAVLAAVLVCTTALAAGGEGKITVSLRVEGIEENILYIPSLQADAGDTVYDILVSALEDEEISFFQQDGYITEIAGDKSGTFDGKGGKSCDRTCSSRSG